jgi:amino acid permease
LVLLLAFLAAVTFSDMYGKEKRFPPGSMGLAAGLGYLLSHVFPAPWSVRRIASLVVAAVLVLASVLQLTGILRVSGIFTGVLMILGAVLSWRRTPRNDAG